MASYFALSALALALCLGLVQCQFVGRDQTLSECREKVMDIYFVLDSSTSIWENDVERERQFVRDVVRRLEVSESSTRVGILAFSDDVHRPTLGFNSIQVKSDVLSSINEQNLPHLTGRTSTDKAIRYVRENTEFRQDITKVIVVITDGESRDQSSTAREANLARENGFYLFVVGVGQHLDQNEWRAIASDPDEDFIYSITNFTNLPTVRVPLTSRACGLPPIIFGACGIRSDSAVYFAAEASATQSAMELLDDFVDRTVDNQNNLRMSIFMDACSNAVDLPLEDTFYCDRFYDVSGSEITPYRDLLGQVRAAVRASRERGERKKHVAVLFVDENTMRSNRFDFNNEARQMQREGVEIITVDLGVRTYKQSLQDMPDNSDNYVAFQSGSVALQPRAMREVLDSTCGALNYEQANPPEIQ